MRCRQAEKLICDYIDGAVSESERLGLERHLSECRTCEAASAALVKSLGLLHSLPKCEPSENFNWKLRLRLARERNAWRGTAEPERVWQKAWQSRFALGAVAAFAVVLVAGFVFLKLADGPGGAPRGFDFAPGASRVATPQPTSVAGGSRPAGGTERIDPCDLDGFGGFGAHSVSSGSPSPLGFDVSGGGAAFEADSLGYRPITARKDYQRIRQLELQVEILRKELEHCNLGRGE